MRTAWKSDPEATSFWRVIEVFLAGMEAVDELTSYAREHARPLDDEQKVIREAISSNISGTTPEQDKFVLEQLSEMFARLSKVAASDAKSADPASTGPNADFVENLQPIIDETFAEIGPIISEQDNFLHYMQAHTKRINRVARLSVLNSALLTSAVSNFEVLISNLIKQFLRARPQALRSDDSKYSMSEIAPYESLREFQDFAADRYVEGVLRGSFDDWMQWFERQLKIKLLESFAEGKELREVFQRRHLFVHNGGVVNRQYLSKLDGMREPPGLGKQLTVDSRYLARSIDSLTSAGLILSALVMRKLVPLQDHDQVADSLTSNACYEFLMSGRWAVVGAVTSALASDCVSDQTRLTMQVNGWVARKNSDGVEVIRAEVEAWQVGALAPRFQLARLALLDLTDQALTLATEMMARGELRQAEWNEWPLLASVRDAAKMSGDEPPTQLRLEPPRIDTESDTRGTTSH